MLHPSRSSGILTALVLYILTKHSAWWLALTWPDLSESTLRSPGSSLSPHCLQVTARTVWLIL